MNTSIDVRGSPASPDHPLATPFTVMLTVAVSVMIVLLETYPAWNYAFAATLGGLLLRCFPVEPMLSISGVRPLPWRRVRLAHND